MSNIETKVIVANWKMNGSIDLLTSFSSFQSSKHQIIICPPNTLINTAREILPRKINIGGQNCNENELGAFTGEISALMLYEAGARYVILGHSERRSIFREDNKLISKKIETAVKAGLIPILCVGETLEEKKRGVTKEVVKKQLNASIPREFSSGDLVVAYEPVWAIGTGLIPTMAEIEEIHEFIEACLTETFDFSNKRIPILYGGSANARNCADILSIKLVGGLLVGGASLKIDELTKITQT